MSAAVGVFLFIANAYQKTPPPWVLCVLLTIMSSCIFYATTGWMWKRGADAAQAIGRTAVVIFLAGGAGVGGWFYFLPVLSRTKVQVDEFGLIINPDGRQVVAMVTFRNKGPSVAERVHGIVQPIFVTDPDPLTENAIFSTISRAVSQQRGTYDPLGIDMTRTFSNPSFVLTSAQADLWTTGKIVLYVVGELHYTDDAGELRTEVCWPLPPRSALPPGGANQIPKSFHGFCKDGHNRIGIPATMGPENSTPPSLER